MFFRCACLLKSIAENADILDGDNDKRIVRTWDQLQFNVVS